MNALDPAILQSIVESDPDGVVVIDALTADQPVIYANPAFARMTGLAADELVGRNPRVLQAKDGSLLWNELMIQPLKNADGRVTHFVGRYRYSGQSGQSANTGDRPRSDPKTTGARDVQSTQAAPISVVREDRLTGLYNRQYFDELVRRDWAIAQRDGRCVAWFIFDIDALGLYNETFGRNAGDACIRRVARTIAGHFRRASDLTARYLGGTVIAAGIGMTAELAAQHARIIRDKVAELHIHHPRCTVQKFITVSGGITAGVPASQDSPQANIEKVLAALKQAKAGGRNRIQEAP
jgi:diguanylate cyclase (GGDEF)-like protein